jgi:hypothetical protein
MIIAAFDPAATAPATCGCSVQTSPAAKTMGTSVRNNSSTPIVSGASDPELQLAPSFSTRGDPCRSGASTKSPSRSIRGCRRRTRVPRAGPPAQLVRRAAARPRIRRPPSVDDSARGRGGMAPRSTPPRRRSIFAPSTQHVRPPHQKPVRRAAWRSSQPWQNGHWNTDLPHSAPRPGRSGGQYCMPVASMTSWACTRWPLAAVEVELEPVVDARATHHLSGAVLDARICRQLATPCLVEFGWRPLVVFRADPRWRRRHGCSARRRRRPTFGGAAAQHQGSTQARRAAAGDDTFPFTSGRLPLSRKSSRDGRHFLLTDDRRARPCRGRGWSDVGRRHRSCEASQLTWW